MEFILDTLGKVGFDWRMGLFNLVNFFIVLIILKKFLFGPITKVIAERQDKARESVQNFQKAKTELQMAERKAQELLDDAKGQANTIVEKSHETAKAHADKLKAAAKEEIETLIAQAKKNIAIDKAEMKDALRAETVGLVLQVTEKLLGDNMDKKKNEAFVKDLIGSLK